MLKLLIVDDEPVIRNGLSHMIRSEGGLEIEIRTAADGIEALHVLDDFHPDLLITDIQMPEMNGLELIREARNRNVKRFVVLSGFDEFSYAQQAIRLQVEDYLLKPIRQKDLSELLRRTAEAVEEEAGRDAEQEASFARRLENDRDGMHAKVKQFRQFVQEHYTRDISLEEVADHLELHPNYLCTLLKRELGTTFVHYLHDVRIGRAKALLKQSNDTPLEQVAHQVGYGNPRHFYKVFKQFVGQTPGSYRSDAAP